MEWREGVTGTISWAIGLTQLTHVCGLTRRLDPAGRSHASGGLTQQWALKRLGGSTGGGGVDAVGKATLGKSSAANSGNWG